MLKVLTTVTGEPTTELICARLAGAGITALAQRSIGGPEWGVSGAQDVYVEEHDLDRAREVLDAGDIGDEELAELSRRAYRDATGHEPAG